MAQEIRVGGGGFGLGSAYSSQMNANRQLSLQEREQAQREMQALAQLQLQRQAQAENVQRMGLEYAQLGAQQNAARLQAGMGILNQRAEAEQAQRERDFRSQEAGAARGFQAQQGMVERDFRSEQADLDRQIQQAESLGRREDAQALREVSERHWQSEQGLRKDEAQRRKEEADRAHEFETKKWKYTMDEGAAKRDAELIKQKIESAKDRIEMERMSDTPSAENIQKAKDDLDEAIRQREELLRIADEIDKQGPDPRSRDFVGPPAPEEVSRPLDEGRKSPNEAWAKSMAEQFKSQAELRRKELSGKIAKTEADTEEAKATTEAKKAEAARKQQIHETLGAVQKVRDPRAVHDRLKDLPEEQRSAILAQLPTNIRRTAEALGKIESTDSGTAEKAVYTLKMAKAISDMPDKQAQKDAELEFARTVSGGRSVKAVLNDPRESGLSYEQAVSAFQKRISQSTEAAKEDDTVSEAYVPPTVKEAMDSMKKNPKDAVSNLIIGGEILDALKDQIRRESPGGKLPMVKSGKGRAAKVSVDKKELARQIRIIARMHGVNTSTTEQFIKNFVNAG